ncbi:MAG: PAS/PAC sensor signal transduction histidine kinase, partial [Candidatus Moranbacteria bacterium GW2011_GWD2_38_7]
KSEFGQMIRITVSDTGIGIPKEEIPYLFKKFSRGKDVSRLHVGGTGLGLFVGKAIAEAHHGQVWVESDGAGLGSRFIIEIPVEHVN